MDYEKEGRFLPVPENDELSQSSKSSIGSMNQRKHLIVRKNKGKGKKFITAFETNYGNTFCINARTNQQYNVKFGSKEEESLFSVIIATGETGQTPIVLFYDNPEQYERHFDVLIKDETKQRWHKRKSVRKL